MALDGDREVGVVVEVLRVPSRIHRARAGAVELLVVHAMGEWVIDGDGVFRHCTDHLQWLGLSVHAFCLPDGRIIESVATDRLAFHAGPVNDRSIGIELIVAGGHDLMSLEQRMDENENPPYTPAQYQAAGWWLRRCADEHRLSFAALRTHAELDPERKKDPGRAFDLEALRAAFDLA